ncbi:MAG: hypothetical protein IPH08_18410 [Rhodocyclaceae bacterium]|jgi:uncharacterized membrane protein YqiK|nr:hypothetical protein [Rhodocyclaceae bacterium]
MELILTAIVILAIFVFGLFALFAKFYHKVEQGHAMIVNNLSAMPEVTFTGGMVYPIIHKMEMMEISIKTIVIKRTGNQGLICKDNIRADIEVTFFVHVNKTTADVMKVAQNIGCARASSQETLEELFAAKFSEALKTAGKSMNFEDLYQARDRFRDEILRQIGDNLSGYVLEDAAIDYLEQTPLDRLDPRNIMDAQGIRKITELTAIEHIQTNQWERDEQAKIKKKDVETQETIYELERQQAEAQARQLREIAVVQAREEAESRKVQSEERAKGELAGLQADQLIAVQKENVRRETEVAANNRQRAVAIEEERVTRARLLEIVDREKEVTLQTIDKDKAVEVQKKAIADVIRERVIVERTVAEQEEAIKEVRLVSEADRVRKSTVIEAEGKAEHDLVLQVKAAESDERKARHQATRDLTLAEAKLKVAEKDAEAKKREAEGIEAYAAAPGLAAAKVQLATADANEKAGMVAAKVKIADADATAKFGTAEADVLRLKLEAQAQGNQQLGMVAAKVKIADADATAKYGTAEADVLRLKLEAQAQGNQQLGMAAVTIKAADAEAVSKQGHAEGEAVEARMIAEARGLKEKFAAMAEMSPETRAHEEYRVRVNNAHIEILKGIEAQTSIAKEQAEVLSSAMSHAKIDIVGGEGDYFQRFVNALAVGKGIDGAIAKSETLQIALKDHLAGERDMVGDLQGLIGALGSSSPELQNLSLTAIMTKVMQEGTADQRSALQKFVTSLRN